jgi:hypothetical protein
VRAAVVRLRRDLFDHMHEDLARPHRFAFERVGFLFGKMAVAGDLTILLPYDFSPVADEHYIKDHHVGALIGRDAMFDAHQRARASGLCCLHVHSHGGSGRTWFSAVDLATLNDIGPSLQRMAKHAAHGGLVLTDATAEALLWLPAETDSVRAGVSIVGFPTTFHRGPDDL